MDLAEEVTGVELPEGIRGAVAVTDDGRVFVVMKAGSPGTLAS